MKLKCIADEMLIQVSGGTVHLVDEKRLGEECIIFNLYVDDGYRNQGLGSKLIRLALSYIYKHGYEKAFIVIKDKSLITFYKKLGFVQTGDNEMYHYKMKSNCV